MTFTTPPRPGSAASPPAAQARAHLALTSPSLVAIARSAFAREERALQRARAALARYALPTAPVDALLAELRALAQALPPAPPAPAAPVADRPVARPAVREARPRVAPRAVQTDWLADLETRRDDVAAFLGGR